MNLNSIQRFVFENDVSVRGSYFCSNTELQKALSQHGYSLELRSILGETLAAALICGNILKYHGKLSIQIQTKEYSKLLLAECTDQNTFRLFAKVGTSDLKNKSFMDIFSGGRLAITVTPEKGNQYQSIVPLIGDTLEACLNSYFAQSEQLKTRIWLNSDGNTASGFLLQTLPAKNQLHGQTEAYLHPIEDVFILAETLRPSELIEADLPHLLQKLFSNQDIRLFNAAPVSFCCTCSKEKMLEVLGNLPQSELAAILQKKEFIEINCQFCNKTYLFTEPDLSR